VAWLFIFYQLNLTHLKTITMKRIFTISALVVTGLLTGFKSPSPQVHLNIQNNCNTDVKIYVTQSGGGTTYTIDHNHTRPMTIEAGQKIYDGNQKYVMHEVSTSSEGKTVVICN
jgi:hypothetical protein